MIHLDAMIFDSKLSTAQQVRVANEFDGVGVQSWLCTNSIRLIYRKAEYFTRIFNYTRLYINTYM